MSILCDYGVGGIIYEVNNAKRYFLILNHFLYGIFYEVKKRKAIFFTK